jgi:exosortase
MLSSSMVTSASRVAQSEAALSASNSKLPVTLLVWPLALLILCYFPVLKLLVTHWITDEDMGHAFFVPVIAGYIVWQKWGLASAVFSRPNYFGLLIVGLAGVQLYVATLGAELFLARTAFVFAVIGVLWFLGGTQFIKALTFPLFLLFFMIPIPAIIYNQITFPLQLFASAVAENLLGILGIPVVREGNVLELASQKLSVVEACSGIRSLLSLSFISLVYTYFFDQKVWMRAVLLVATVPIAIAANAARVTMTGILSEYKKEYAEGFLHSASGWLLFMAGLLMLIATHKALNIIYAKLSDRNRG